MKKKILFPIIALMIFCSAAFAEITTEYEITPPDDKKDMNFEKGAYNEIGTLKIGKKAADSYKSFDPLKKVVITADYDNSFKIGLETTDVQYKLYRGGAKSEATELQPGGEIVLSGSEIDSGVEIKLACEIESDTSKLPAGYYFSKPKFKHKSFINPEVGDIVNFGKFNGNPLSWRVLDVDTKNKRALLITENVVAKRKFATSNYEWSTSDVRAYLNGTDGDNFFSSSNFTDNEKSRIFTVLINSTTVDKKSSEIIKSTGTDYVFLLGVRDANEYFSDDSDRIANFNNAAVKWWLRYSTSSYARAGYVSTKGKVVPDGSLVSYSTVGVRPAIWISLGTQATTPEAEFEIGFKKDTPSVDSVEADESVLTMSSPDIEAKYKDKTNVVMKGELNSSQLSEILKKIVDVTGTMIEDLDLRSLNISKITLDDVNVSILNMNLDSNQYIQKIETKDSYFVTLNLSNSSIEEIESDGCEFLGVTLENCKSVKKLNFVNTTLKTLVVKGCENLIELSCESSDLTDLDLEGCQALTKLNVKKNYLRKLNVSKTNFPNLTDFSCEDQEAPALLTKIFDFAYFLKTSEIIDSTVASLADDTSDISNVENLQVYDKDGKKLRIRLSKAGIATISGTAPYKLTYNYKTGFEKENGENILMNVTVSPANLPSGGAGDGFPDEENSPSSGSSGGCNSGFGLMAFAFLGLVQNFARKKFTKK